MKILVISDSHGLEHELYGVAEKYKAEMDMMIHCGDSELPSTHEALEHFLVVQGNCDFDLMPSDLTKELGNLKLYVTHGHLYNVKMTLMNICYKAEEVGADIVCFGHSHFAGSEIVNGKLFINPGSFRLPRDIKEKTYCILEINKRDISVNFYNDRHEKLERLCYNYKL